MPIRRQLENHKQTNQSSSLHEHQIARYKERTKIERNKRIKNERRKNLEIILKLKIDSQCAYNTRVLSPSQVKSSLLIAIACIALSQNGNFKIKYLLIQFIVLNSRYIYRSRHRISIRKKFRMHTIHAYEIQNTSKMKRREK